MGQKSLPFFLNKARGVHTSVSFDSVANGLSLLGLPSISLRVFTCGVQPRLRPSSSISWLMPQLVTQTLDTRQRLVDATCERPKSKGPFTKASRLRRQSQRITKSLPVLYLLGVHSVTCHCGRVPWVASRAHCSVRIRVSRPKQNNGSTLIDKAVQTHIYVWRPT